MNTSSDPSPEASSADCALWMGPQRTASSAANCSPHMLHRPAGDVDSGQHCDGGVVGSFDFEARQLGRVMTEKVVIEEDYQQDNNELEPDKTVMNGHIGVVNLRVKKQRIASSNMAAAPITAAASTAVGSANDQERPMSWEGELSDDDLLSTDGGAKTPSTLTDDIENSKSPSVMTIEPGSPMSINGSDMDEAIPSLRKPIVESPLLKTANQNLSPVLPRHLTVTAGLGHPSISGLPEQASNQLTHYYTPQASPLQARHINGHSYSSSSSPELAKHLFYSPNQSPLQSRHITNVASPYSQSPSPRHMTAQETAASTAVAAATAASATTKTTPYSPTESPVQSRHVTSQDSPYSSPYSSVGSPSGSSSIPFSPNQSPVQGRHPPLLPPCASTSSETFGASKHHLLATSGGVTAGDSGGVIENSMGLCDQHDDKGLFAGDLAQHAALAGQAGISRQQLINSPCPICGDKISGFHYGIFSCESCKGFFKRTVQNKKNYLCLRGATCPVSVNTRKKCPACRFDKCLKMGMKLEAIREDRTRGGRSTYQCSYTLPSTMLHSPIDGKLLEAGMSLGDSAVSDIAEDLSTRLSHDVVMKGGSRGNQEPSIPELIQEIMSVEHLWHCSEGEVEKMMSEQLTFMGNNERGPDFFSNLCDVADHRLYKIVKWCKSLPLFRYIQIDDQICLLLNSWCELLLLSCCYRSIPTPDEIRVSLGKSLNLGQARTIGLDHVIERMLNLTEHLRRLRIDQHEYVCLKVIILLTSDVTGLKQPETVRQSQEKVIQALQMYSLSHYPLHPSKFGELLLRIPELKRTCLIGKESLSVKHREGEVPSFNLLIELLRGEH